MDSAPISSELFPFTWGGIGEAERDSSVEVCVLLVGAACFSNVPRRNVRAAAQFYGNRS